MTSSDWGRVRQKYRGRLTLREVNVERNLKLALHQGVSAIPSVVAEATTPEGRYFRRTLDGKPQRYYHALRAMVEAFLSDLSS